MSNRTKQIIIALLSAVFILSLIFVQALEVVRRREEAGLAVHRVSIPESSKRCVECHDQNNPGIIDHWKGSTHALRGVGCVECHAAEEDDADSFGHYGHVIATVVTPRDCGKCHTLESEEFQASHHAKAGNILASLDNFLAETVEGSRVPFNPHAPTPGMDVTEVNGMASVNIGCQQCHGSRVALVATSGAPITVEDLEPDENGQPTNMEAVRRILRDGSQRPVYHSGSWPNTGIGRINLDGSLGSCSACHSRHDFSPRRARQPENCGKCHLGPDHPQKEIFEESKHGVAYRDLRDHMNLDAATWILGQDYTQAPTCATCHMSGHLANDGRVTHNPGERISWTNRPPISALLDTDAHGARVTTTDPDERAEQIHDSWREKRTRMQEVCSHCHTPNYIENFYQQYDDFIINYNEKFGRPGQMIVDALYEQGLITEAKFDEEIEWTWFYLWHHEGRRARHGAAMMAPDYAHWHGMYEVAERFYMELIPQAREIAEEGLEGTHAEGGRVVLTLIDEILARPEHAWFEAERPRLADGEPPGSEAAGELAAEPEDRPDPVVGRRLEAQAVRRPE